MSNRPLLPLKFLAIGGGLAGLACAYALRTAGHDIVIIEKNDETTKTEGSIRSPPNMTRILNTWPGMKDFLQTHATRCSGLSFRSGDASQPLGFMKFHDRIMSDLEADFLFVQHDDLKHELLRLCSTAGVVFKHSKAVDILKSAGSIAVTLEDGNTLLGDIVIGADGRDSWVRSFVVEDELRAKHVVPGANISISTKLMREHDELSSLCDEQQYTIWMGNGSSITGIFDDKCETFNLTICSPYTIDSPDCDWYTSHPVSELPFDLSGYDARLQKLVQLGSSCRPTVHRVLEQEDVTSRDGTVALVGDAAHSVLIHSSQNSSMAIEDAVTLGKLFSRLTNRKQIPVFLAAYEEIRQPRTGATQTSEYQSLVQISLPRGSQQEARDAQLNLTLGLEFDDSENLEASDLLVQAWDQYLLLFSHDASEEVDNWWSKWGVFTENEK
ncbi:hypothetical protein C8R43DRAFT_1053367 [Mycena crocata]|nr:hypothetical protein C8R43DRAFT_1053946 [Mycena crocata]KAJ7078365.1 hypothetical protein C8R43DRAFT_1053367 [Mycena crocata]